MGHELMLRRRLMMAGQAIWKEITGNLPLTLNKSLAKKFKSLIRYGKAEHVPKEYLDTITQYGKVTQPPVDYLSTVTQAGAVEQRNLPQGYTEREYIQSSGTQYIDLGYKGNGNTKVEVKFRYYTASSATGSGRVFGSRATAQSSAFAIGASSGTIASTETNKLFWCYGNQPFYVDSGYFGLDEWKTVVFSAKQHTIDGVSAGDDYNIEEFETPQNLKLFGFDHSSGGMGFGYLDVEYCKLWNNGVLVRDVVPATRDSDNAVGMYDRVSGAFLTNAGTGDFTAGPVATPTPNNPMDIWCNNGVLKARHQSGLPLGHTLLSYIQSSGYQIIDTGYLLRDTDRVEMDYTLIAADHSGDTFLLGARNPSDGSYGGVWISAWLNNSVVYDKWYVRFGSSTSAPVTQFPAAQQQGTLSLGKGQFVVNGTVVATPNYASMPIYPLTLFNRYAANGALEEGKGAYMQMSEARIFDGDNNLIHRYVADRRDSDNEVGVYDLVDGVFIGNTGTGAFTAGTPVSDPVEVYPDGVPSTVTDADGNTATLETLLAVGDYKDTQEVIAGAIGRAVGVYVCTGASDEVWYYNSSVSEMFVLDVVLAPSNLSDRSVPCTHFKTAASIPGLGERDGYAVLSAAGRVGIGYNAANGSVTDFKAFLAAQYAAGDPVIVVYPLATPTTESVPGQVLVNEPLTVSAEVTLPAPTTAEAAVSTPDPKHPLPLWCNNGKLEVRHQSGLPLGYQKIEYIQSSGTQYINTGISAFDLGNDNPWIEATFSMEQEGDVDWFGCSLTSGGILWNITISSSSHLAIYEYPRWGSTGSLYNYLTYAAGKGVNDLGFYQSIHTLRIEGLSPASVYVDGVLIATISWNSSSMADTNEILLFKGRSGGNAAKWTSFRAGNAAGTVVDLVASKRSSDSVPGMYDKVSGQFRTNEGTGDFVAGAAVSDPIEPYEDGTPELLTVSGKNLFDVNTMLVQGKAVRANNPNPENPLGSEISDPVWNCSDYIAVSPDTTYTYIIPDSIYAVAAGMVFYSSKSVAGAISGLSQTASLTRTFTTPPNCKYVRISWYMGHGYGNDVQLELGSTATAYEPYHAQTASVPMLLAVGNYKDSVELIAGVKTGRIGVKVLTGQEPWVKGTSSFYADGVITDFKVESTSNQYPLCTHYATAGSEPAAQLANTNSIRLYSTGSMRRINIFAVLDDYADATAFAAFLAAQYAAGTPVILLYPLATETTENLTERISYRETDAVISYTAEVSDITVATTRSSHTTPAPDTPLDIVCNNGALTYGFQYRSYNVAPILSAENYPGEDGRSASYSDGVLICVITASAGSNLGLYPPDIFSFTVGHKYACMANAKGDTRIVLGAAQMAPSGAITGAGATTADQYTLTSDYAWYAKLWECNTNATARLNIRVVSSGAAAGQYASFKDILLVDLTTIFGAGNEPTTSSAIIQSTVGIYADAQPVKNLTPVNIDGTYAGDGTSTNISNDLWPNRTVKENVQYTISIRVVPSGVTYSQTGNLAWFSLKYTDGTQGNVGITNTNYQNGLITWTTAAGKTLASDYRMVFSRHTRWTDGTLTITDLQIEEGSIATPYEPYHTGELLTVSGKNLFNKAAVDANWKVGYIINDSGNEAVDGVSCYSTYFIPIKPNTSYIASWVGEGAVLQRFYWYMADGTFISRSNATSTAQTSPANAAYMRVQRINTAYLAATDVQIEEGSASTAYEPYHEPQTVTDIPMLLSVGDYKDECELISGLLTHKIAVAVFDGTEAWQSSSTAGIWYVEAVGSARSDTRTALPCTHYTGTTEVNSTMPNNSVKLTVASTFPSSNAIYIKDTACANVTAFKAFLTAQYAAGTPVIVVYPLATETTEQTTPQALNSYKGTTVVDTVCAAEPVAAKVIYKAKK